MVFSYLTRLVNTLFYTILVNDVTFSVMYGGKKHPSHVNRYQWNIQCNQGLCVITRSLEHTLFLHSNSNRTRKKRLVHRMRPQSMNLTHSSMLSKMWQGAPKLVYPTDKACRNEVECLQRPCIVSRPSMIHAFTSTGSKAPGSTYYFSHSMTIHIVHHHSIITSLILWNTNHHHFA